MPAGDSGFMSVLDIVLVVVLTLVCAGGMLLTVLQFPGTWLIAVAAAGYAWYYDWNLLSMWVVLLVFGVASAAEIIELLCGMWAGRRGGASRRAGWFGLIGAIAGAILLTIPVPVIGTLIGAAVGAFAGALVGEITGGAGLSQGVRSGSFTAVGRVVGATVKVGAAATMSGFVLIAALAAFWRGS